MSAEACQLGEPLTAFGHNPQVTQDVKNHDGVTEEDGRFVVVASSNRHTAEVVQGRGNHRIVSYAASKRETFATERRGTRQVAAAPRELSEIDQDYGNRARLA